MIYRCNPPASQPQKVLNIPASFPSVRKWPRNVGGWQKHPCGIGLGPLPIPLLFLSWMRPPGFSFSRASLSFLGPICAFSMQKGGEVLLEKNYGAPPSPLGGKSERPASCLPCCRCNSDWRKNTVSLCLRCSGPALAIYKQGIVTCSKITV